MNRDGRGNPGRIVVKNQPRLQLVDVIRRRRTTLDALMGQLGLTTYAGLEIWCDRMGIQVLTREMFTSIYTCKHPPVNSPQEGIVVLESPPVVREPTGALFDPESPTALSEQPVVDATVEPPVRRSRRTNAPPLS